MTHLVFLKTTHLFCPEKERLSIPCALFVHRGLCIVKLEMTHVADSLRYTFSLGREALTLDVHQRPKRYCPSTQAVPIQLFLFDAPPRTLLQSGYHIVLPEYERFLSS